MTTYTTMDYKKYIYALGTRDIRRIAAKVRRANLENEIIRLLEQAEVRLFLAAFFDGADDTVEDGTSVVDGNLGTYSHGRQVTTTIDWGHGYATLVHHPAPQEQETRQDRRGLEEEVWPSGDPGTGVSGTDLWREWATRRRIAASGDARLTGRTAR